MDYVAVKYWHRDGEMGRPEGYYGRAYTYETALPLKGGEAVIAPTVNGAMRAIVVDTGLEKPQFPCREIAEYWHEDEEGVEQ